MPIINNRYWAEAVRGLGYAAETLVQEVYAINRRADFDLVFDDLVPSAIRQHLPRRILGHLLAFTHILRHAAVLHIPYSGGPLGRTPLWRLEAPLLKLAGIKIVVLAYGADAYRYSQVIDPSWRHVLLMDYPAAARREPALRARVDYWNRHADIVLTGLMLDGLGRWDVPLPSLLFIDTDLWPARIDYSPHDGVDGPVHVIHTPNHRGVKGTEFVIRAVEDLRAEGLDVRLDLLEQIPNEVVRSRMQQADILVEQLLVSYAMSGLEGMASGLPVLSNLESPQLTRIFRRYSFLDQCPVVSAGPETLKPNLRTLVRRPDLREILGRTGRQYVEHYHSYAAARYLFGAIYDKILHGRDVDLMNLFHPLKSPRPLPPIKHPLIDSRLPNE